MRAVVIGAGRVGLGCAADLLHRAGLDVVVLGRGETVRGLQRHGRVRVQVTEGASVRAHDVPLTAIDLALDRERAVRAIATADLVCTAVGPAQLMAVCDVLGDGLAAAPSPVDVIALENTDDAGEVLRRGTGARGARHGFSGAVVDRVVARRDDATAYRPVSVTTEPTCRVVVDRDQLHRDWSWLPGVVATDRFLAWFRAKLHCYSAGHATAAYLGHLKGYRSLHAAVTDPEIAAAVLGAMEEGRAGIAHRDGLQVAGSREDLHAILRRFGNAALGDTVARVGRDVPRKLARDDRLVGAARAARAAGVRPVHLTFAAAAALRSHLPDPPTDASDVVARLTGLRPGSQVARMVQQHWAELATPAAMLSLHAGLPAWESMRRSAA